MNDSAAAPNEVENPIINSAFAEPRYHGQIEAGGRAAIDMRYGAWLTGRGAL